MESKEQKNDAKLIQDLQNAVLDLKKEAKTLKDENKQLQLSKDETETKLKSAL